MWNAIIDLPAVGEGGGSAQPCIVIITLPGESVGQREAKTYYYYLLKSYIEPHGIHFFHTIFFCTILRAPNVVAIG